MGQPTHGEVSSAARIVRQILSEKSSMVEVDEAENRARAQMRDLIKEHTESRVTGDGRRPSILGGFSLRRADESAAEVRAPRSSVADQASVEEVATELERVLALFKGALTEEVAARWDEVVLMLYRAAALLDPRRAGRGDRSGYALVEQAERVLRDELGQIGTPVLPEDMRYAALDAHKVLYRRVLS